MDNEPHCSWQCQRKNTHVITYNFFCIALFVHGIMISSHAGSIHWKKDKNSVALTLVLRVFFLSDVTNTTIKMPHLCWNLQHRKVIQHLRKDFRIAFRHNWRLQLKVAFTIFVTLLLYATTVHKYICTGTKHCNYKISCFP